MNLDLEAMRAAALAAGGGWWTATDGIVWFDDGDSALIVDPAHAVPPVFSAYDNLGAWPDAIDCENVANFAALACPAAVLALIERLEQTERNRDMWKGQCGRQAEALRKQGASAKMGMDAAKANGAAMERSAKAMLAQSNPDAL